jgi:hypothetical protein
MPAPAPFLPHPADRLNRLGTPASTRRPTHRSARSSKLTSDPQTSRLILAAAAAIRATEAVEGPPPARGVPAVQAVSADEIDAAGPLPADTAFFRASRGDFDIAGTGVAEPESMKAALREAVRLTTHAASR